MQNLKTFFTNHYDTDRISDNRLRKFTEDHLQRTAELGTYPNLVTETQAVYTGYFGAITDEATKTAIREGQTKAVEAAVKAIKNAVSQQEGLIRAKYGKDSPEYQEFLPQGVSEYADATLANIETLVVRFANAAEAHKAELTGLNTQFNQLHTAFTTARNAQLGTKGEVAAGKATTATSRDAVEIQLMKNLLAIALDHIGDPQGGLAYFDQSILESPGTEDKPEPPPTP